MVAGRLQEKKGLFYMVLSYKDPEGKNKTKWISTKLPVKGNKKKAQEMLMEVRKSFDPGKPITEADIAFSKFMQSWLEIVRPNLEATTYSAYANGINQRIAPYFEKKGVLLKDLQASHIQSFYTYCMSENGYNVSANTVIRYHANIRKALQYAVKTDLLVSNPADKVERPRVQKYVGKFYDEDEMSKLFEAVKDTRIELIVTLAAFYGFRRSEVIGLKWDAIDFDRDIITVRHTVTQVIDPSGHIAIIQKDRTKNSASRRTLPLIPDIKKKLQELKAQQKEHRRVCKSCYDNTYLGYIFVDEMGGLIRPNYVTVKFQAIIAAAGLRKIRFHDLRHTCASLLLANGIGLKEIQEWLGHSTFSTTADIYAHLDYSKKVDAANTMASVLSIGSPENASAMGGVL